MKCLVWAAAAGFAAGVAVYLHSHGLFDFFGLSRLPLTVGGGAVESAILLFLFSFFFGLYWAGREEPPTSES